ncbi:MAG: hypothetical protein QOJ72_765 [Nocardioidaceae bacterium]|nr:hypothetical protein [Nocardioidaceae bacterium]
MKTVLRLCAVLIALAMSVVTAGSAQAGSPKWLSISTSDSHTCGIRTDHSLYCWGRNTEGELGLGATGARHKPTRVGTSTSWVSVAAGGAQTCALHNSGSIYCWGENSAGEIGQGNTSTGYNTPTKVGSSTSWKSVTVGFLHVCALHSSGSIYCWGGNGDGQVGNGTPNDVHAPAKVGSSTHWLSVTATDSFHTCARHSSGSIYCWGNNDSGELGIGNNTAVHYVPTKAGTSTSWTSVTVGSDSSCARHNSGSIYCWGYNGTGQLGDGTTTTHYTPTKVGTSTSWTAVRAGSQHTCAQHSGGTLYCWGDNQYGALGDGTGLNHLTPTKVGASIDWAALAVGRYGTCAISTGGYAYCWGKNDQGQLGIGSITDAHAPTKITATN